MVIDQHHGVDRPPDERLAGAQSSPSPLLPHVMSPSTTDHNSEREGTDVEGKDHSPSTAFTFNVKAGTSTCWVSRRKFSSH